jgi:hypothetical protein
LDAGQGEDAGTGLGQAAAGQLADEGDVVAVGVEGGAAGAERRQTGRDVQRIAGRPLQAAAVQGDLARAEVVGGIEVDQAAGHRGGAGVVAVRGVQYQRAGAALAEAAAAGQRVRATERLRAAADVERRRPGALQVRDLALRLARSRAAPPRRPRRRSRCRCPRGCRR